MSEFCLVREPIFGADNSLLGYEIRYRDTGDGLEALSRTLESGSFNQLRDRKPAFVMSSAHQLLSNAFSSADPSTLVLLLPNSVEVDPDVIDAIQKFRDAGGTIALDDLGETESPSELLLEEATWVRLGVGDYDLATLNRIRERVERHNKKLKILAFWVEEREQYDLARQASADGFQGTFFAFPEPVATTNLPKSTVAAIQLLGMARDPNVSDRELEEVLESDPVLTFQLLQLVNSAAVGLRGVSSIGQALRLIGRAVFQRWMAVAVAGSRKSTNGVDEELVRKALARGRMMEQLAGADRDPGTLFLIGLFSMLGSVFRMPIHDILKRVSLSDEANAALLDRTGPYADALTVAELYERGQFEAASDLAQRMGLNLGTISQRYTDAVVWTADALDSLNSQGATA